MSGVKSKPFVTLFIEDVVIHIFINSTFNTRHPPTIHVQPNATSHGGNVIVYIWLQLVLDQSLVYSLLFQSVTFLLSVVRVLVHVD